MSIKREPIRLYLESAPKNPFDEDGPRLYRVMATVGREGDKLTVPLTRSHTKRKDAMNVLSDKLLHAVPWKHVEMAIETERSARDRDYKTLKLDIGQLWRSKKNVR